jgi:hypothetical protein
MYVMFQFSQNKIHTKPYDLRRCLIKFNHNLKVYNKNFQRKANLIRSINDLLRGDYKRFEYHIIMDDQSSQGRLKSIWLIKSANM